MTSKKAITTSLNSIARIFFFRGGGGFNGRVNMFRVSELFFH